MIAAAAELRFDVTIRDHSQAMAPAKTATRITHQTPPSQAAPKARGSRTAAEMKRSRSVWPLAAPSLLASSACGAIPAIASMILADGKFQILPGEVGPETIEEDELGVGALPEQKIADAFFAAGADQKIRVGNALGQQIAGELLLIHRRGIEAPRFGLLGDLARSTGNLRASAVTQSHGQVEAPIGRCALLGLFDEIDDIGAEPAQLPDHANPDPVAIELGDLVHQ